MAEGIKEKFKELRKTYDLPGYEELNGNFEISSMENEEHVLSCIRDSIQNKLDVMLDVLNGMLQPDSDISDLHESRYLTDKDKVDAYLLYRKLMLYKRTIIELKIMNEDKENADFIKEIHNEWIDVKKSFLDIARKLKETWKNGEDIDLDLDYLG